MELRDFAEQILFAKTIDGKLACPEVITDERPGPALAAPDQPSRPPELQFKTQHTGQSHFPGIHRLETDSERGRLLHFFANHELLATELMALALLRFPKAPAAFRLGLLQTLKDEQNHTRLYIERMGKCGIRFGELPVSGFFWRCVSPMESPIDYVSSLCLTFEQANLDFCHAFAEAFSKAGDNETSRLLNRIYRDEIGHVAYGLKWFRRWKNPDQSDWDAFCRQLKFPLSPQRAKGPCLNVAGRRAAGFDTSFIEELAVFSQSKGRTPMVYWFNPFAEGYLAYGSSYTPRKHQRLLAQDLANLPQFLCTPDDIVLVPQRPSIQFLSSVKQAGFPLPEFAELQGRTLPKSVSQRKLGGFQPWAWGPDSVELFQPHSSSAGPSQRGSRLVFSQSVAAIYSKAWSAGFLKSVLARADHADWLCTLDEVGVEVDSMNAALASIGAIRARGHLRAVAKETFGLAGHNSVRLWEPDILPSHRRWMEQVFQNGRKLVIEPWLHRTLDFSIQLQMTPQGIRLRGYTGLINDRKGQFQANWAAPNYQRRLPSPVTSLFTAPPDFPTRVHRLFETLFQCLEAELRRIDYVGPLGIDAFAYRTPTGQSRIKPVVEINPRYTMGRVTLELMRHTMPGRFGVLRLLNSPMVTSAGFSSFLDFATHLASHDPLRLEGEPRKRIASGSLCLNDPACAQRCLAIFQVGHSEPPCTAIN